MTDIEMRMLQMLLLGFGFGCLAAHWVWSGWWFWYSIRKGLNVNDAGKLPPTRAAASIGEKMP